MEAGTTRASRTERRKQGVVLTERDLKIIFTVGRFRLASSSHLAALYFNGVGNTAHKRLRSLYNGGYLQAHVVLGSTEPTLYTLTTQGQRALAERFPGGRDLPAGPRSLDVADLKHRLAIIDVRVTLILATRQSPGFRLIHFYAGTEVTAHTKAAGFAIVPDALVLVEKDGVRHLHLLEVDLGTEPLSVWEGKTRGYAEAILMKRSVLGKTAWQVLIAAPGTTRLNAIARAFGVHVTANRFILFDLSAMTPKTFLDLTASASSSLLSKAHPLLAENHNELQS